MFGLRSDVHVSKVRKSGDKNGGDGGSHKSEQHIQHPHGAIGSWVVQSGIFRERSMCR